MDTKSSIENLRRQKLERKRQLDNQHQRDLRLLEVELGCEKSTPTLSSTFFTNTLSRQHASEWRMERRDLLDNKHEWRSMSTLHQSSLAPATIPSKIVSTDSTDDIHAEALSETTLTSNSVKELRNNVSRERLKKIESEVLGKVGVLSERLKKEKEELMQEVERERNARVREMVIKKRLYKSRVC
jgi:hypothetical protein